MANRRRSRRFPVALSTWLKDGRGGEHTTTADVSSHGVSVYSNHSRPLRQYVELEIALENPPVMVTATALVARHAELVGPTGQPTTGLGLEFFLFDAQAKKHWHVLMERLHGSPQTSTEPVAPAVTSGAETDPEAPVAGDEDDEPPTFIIKPRDLGRLWAFFRGEMTRGRVRIESPVTKPLESPAELLVVHPTSHEEWVLNGKVVDVNAQARGGRPVLEIALVGLDAPMRAEFRNFIATGRVPTEHSADLEPMVVPQEPWDDDDDDEPERIESVMVEAEALDIPSDLIDMPSPFDRPMDSIPSDLIQPEDVIFDDDEGEENLPTQHAPIPRPVDPTPNAPMPAHDTEPSLDAMPAPKPEGTSPTQPIFASFFEEAAASERPTQLPEVEWDEGEVTDAAVPVEADLPLPHVPDRAAPMFDPGAAEAPTSVGPSPRTKVAKPPLPPSARRARKVPEPPPPMPAPSDTERAPAPVPAVTVAPVVTGHRNSAVIEPKHVVSLREDVPINPPLPPGTLFDFGDEDANEAELAIKTAGPLSATPSAPPPARRPARTYIEDRDRARHHVFSTEGTNPELDRDIALARARMVRSPDSVTATYRLGTLLMQKADRRQSGLGDAIDALQKVMQMKPDHAEAHHRLAELLARQGDYESAAEHIGRARDLGYAIDGDLESIVNQGLKDSAG